MYRYEIIVFNCLYDKKKKEAGTHNFIGKLLYETCKKQDFTDSVRDCSLVLLLSFCFSADIRVKNACILTDCQM